MGYASVRKLQQEISAPEFAEWRAYYSIERFGDDWLQAAEICSVVANNSFGARRFRKPEEFIPKKKFTSEKPANLTRAQADAVAAKIKKAWGFDCG